MAGSSTCSRLNGLWTLLRVKSGSIESRSGGAIFSRLRTSRIEPRPEYYDSGDYDACLEEALRRVKEEGWEAERDGLRRAGRLVGIGVATAVHSAASNIGYVTLALPPTERSKPTYNAKSGSSDFAQIALDPSGRLRVGIGTAASGQGHATTVAQIVAREFGVGVRESTLSIA